MLTIQLTTSSCQKVCRQPARRRKVGGHRSSVPRMAGPDRAQAQFAGRVERLPPLAMTSICRPVGTSSAVTEWRRTIAILRSADRNRKTAPLPASTRRGCESESVSVPASAKDPRGVEGEGACGQRRDLSPISPPSIADASTVPISAIGAELPCTDLFARSTPAKVRGGGHAPEGATCPRAEKRLRARPSTPPRRPSGAPSGRQASVAPDVGRHPIEALR